MNKETIITASLLDIINILFKIRPMIYHIKLEKRKNIHCAEIGVRYGNNAKNILKTLDIEKIYLIDPYEDYEEFKYQHIVGKKFNFVKTEKAAKQKLKDYNQKIQWIKKRSEEALEDIQEELDFVYIDGNHSYDFVKKDINMYWGKIKKNGFIGGHDFNNQFGVMRAVASFVEEHHLKLNFYKFDWWIKK